MNFRQVSRFGFDGINVEIRVWRLIRVELEALSPSRIEPDKHSEIVSLGGCEGIILIFVFYYGKAACEIYFSPLLVLLIQPDRKWRYGL